MRSHSTAEHENTFTNDVYPSKLSNKLCNHRHFHFIFRADIRLAYVVSVPYISHMESWNFNFSPHLVGWNDFCRGLKANKQIYLVFVWYFCNLSIGFTANMSFQNQMHATAFSAIFSECLEQFSMTHNTSHIHEFHG